MKYTIKVDTPDEMRQEIIKILRNMAASRKGQINVVHRLRDKRRLDAGAMALTEAADIIRDIEILKE